MEINLENIPTINVEEVLEPQEEIKEEIVEEIIHENNLEDSGNNDEFYDLLLKYVGDNNIDLKYIMDEDNIIRKEYIYSKNDGEILFGTGHEMINKAFVYARKPRLVKDSEDNICIYIGDTLICKIYK